MWNRASSGHNEENGKVKLPSNGRSEGTRRREIEIALPASKNIREAKKERGGKQKEEQKNGRKGPAEKGTNGSSYNQANPGGGKDVRGHC